MPFEERQGSYFRALGRTHGLLNDLWSTAVPLTPAPLNAANRACQTPTDTAPPLPSNTTFLLFIVIALVYTSTLNRAFLFSYISSINTNTSVPPHNLATAMCPRLSYFCLY
jgi:hypothetical protein